ncbi:MAG: hypothetical protein ACXWC6_02555 [Ramlibacter sp.]
MKRTLIALTCSLAFAGASALAQQDKGTSPSQQGTSQPSGGSLTEKAKSAMHRIGDATRNMFHKAGDKTEQAKSDHDTKSMGASRGSDTSTAVDADSGRQKRMDQAYDDYQSKSKSGHSSSTTATPKHQTQ